MGVTETGVCNEEFKTEPNIIENAKKNEDLLEDNCIKRVIEENKYLKYNYKKRTTFN